MDRVVVGCIALCAVAGCGRIDYDPLARTQDAGMDAGVFDDGSMPARDLDIDEMLVSDASDMSMAEAAIIVNPTSGLTTTESSGTATFTVVLQAQPSSDVSIALSSDTPTEGLVAPSMLTFTVADWNAPQVVTVTGVDDALVDGDQSYTIVLAPASSSDATYDGLDAPDVAVTNIDDESAGVTIAPLSGLVTTEAGGTAAFTVVLHALPSSDVVVELTSSAPAEATVSPAMLTFTSVNALSPQTVTVTGVDDFVADGDQSFVIVTAPLTSADLAYSEINPSDIAGVNLDDETPGIIVSPTTGLVTSENGGTALLTVVLQSIPSSGVTIPIVSTDSSEGVCDVAMVSFSPSDWNVAQVVTITGVDDLVADGDQAYAVTTGPATSSDSAYAGLRGADAMLTNTDDESAGFTTSPMSGLVTTESGGTASFSVVLNSAPSASVTFSVASTDLSEGTIAPASLTFSTSDWSTPQLVTATGVDDSVVDGDQPYEVVLHVQMSADPDYMALADKRVDLTNTDDETAGITVSPVSGLVTTEAGGTASFTVVLNSEPLADVSIGLSSDLLTEGTVDRATLTFTTANWNVPQTVVATGVDDFVADGARIYHIITDAAVSADAAYNGENASDVTITNSDNDAAGVVVMPTSGLTTTEAGGTASFTIQLASQPTATVSVSLSSSDTTEGTVSPVGVSFDSMNWNTPQTVTLTGVDDFVVDGSTAYSIITGSASSTDLAYNGLAVADVAATNADNDTLGITVTPTSGLTTTEAGGTAMFTIVLTSEPTANVTIGLSSSNVNEGTPAPASLVFTNADWNVPQPVTVSGVDDFAVDGDVAYSIVTAAAVSTDPGYSGRVVADVMLTNTDNDAVGITVTPTSGLVTSEDGLGASFTIVLASQPSANVTINLMSTNTGEGTVSPASVTFTTANWSVARTVNISGVNDGMVDGDIAYTIVTSAAVSADLSYSGLDPADVSVTNNASTLLISDCTHRWVSSTNLFSNFKFIASSSALIVAGFTSMSFTRIDALSETDGMVSWTLANQGGFGHGTNRVEGIFQNGGGLVRSSVGLTLNTGAMFSSFTHTITSGAFSAQPAAVGTGGEAVVALNTSSASWSFTVSGLGSPITGSAPAAVLVHHDATGAYIEHLTIDTSYQVSPLAMSDGRWLFHFAPGASGATVDGHVVAPSTNELITLTNDLSFDSSVVLPSTPSAVLAIPGSTTRVVNGSTYLRAYNDSGLVWSRDDCRSSLGGAFTHATSSHVYSMRSGSGAWCGRTVPAGTGIAIATLDAATGATVAVRYVTLPLTPSYGAVSLDGDLYVGMSWNGTTAYSACGDAFPILGANGIAIIAL